MLKKKIIILLLSMIAFICVFVYGAFQYIDNPSETKQQKEESELKDAEYRNVWIVQGENKEMTFFTDGILRTVKTTVALGERLEHTFGDITVENGKIGKVRLKPAVVIGKVTNLKENQISVKHDGKTDTYPLSDDFKAYRYNRDMGAMLEKEELVEYSKVSFAQENGKICVAIAADELDIENIRVLLNTTNFKGILHSKVTVTCKTAFTVSNKTSSKTYKAGKKVTIEPSNKRLSAGELVVAAKNKSSKIQVVSITRNKRHPSYRGKIEIGKKDGKLMVINELPFEEYLYAVIPSEMPTSYDIEALKVQAVCARTYAYNQYLQNKFTEYGANIDDSVQSQVYNNIPEDKNSIQAVKKTTGQILKYKNDVIQTYYFSTSWGCTADAGDVWIDGSASVLNGGLQYVSEKKSKVSFDFSKEAQFKKFLSDKKSKTYDSAFPWYRWSVKISAAKLKKSIDASLQKRYKANHALILTQNAAGSFESKPISTVGEVKSIRIGNRCKSGLINECIIEGSKATIKICSEYNIRLLLAPLNSTIKRNDGSKVEGLSMLPSAFFVVSQSKGNFSFQGGGYGHGVGMSQNGAKTMADTGKSYTEILSHYYKGTSLYNLYI